jgi:hypothetical protein
MRISDWGEPAKLWLEQGAHERVGAPVRVRHPGHEHIADPAGVAVDLAQCDHQAGYPQAVAVPDGVGADRRADGNQRAAGDGVSGAEQVREAETDCPARDSPSQRSAGLACGSDRKW